VVSALTHGTRRGVILGTLAQRHPDYSQLKSLAAALADLCGASVGCITEGPNAAGAYLAGAVPHREAAGAAAGMVGATARGMLESPLKAYVLFGGIDPDLDLAADAGALKAADLVLAITTHVPPSLRAAAHVVLPIGSFAETSGTYVNAEGRWQSWAAAVKLWEDSRPGWKVLRVLADLLKVGGIDFDSAEEIRNAVQAKCSSGVQVGSHAAGEVQDGGGSGGVGGSGSGGSGGRAGAEPGLGAAVVAAPDKSAAPAWVDIPPYQIDVLVRGSDALAKTRDGRLTRTVL
jgi:NADH-quinone oxidoreductase subunit G